MKKSFLDLPEGIKILSALIVVTAFALIFIGISIAGLFDIASTDSGFLVEQGLPALASWNYLLFGLLTIVLGYALYMLVTRGLNQGRNWAKYVLTVVLILLVISPLRSMFSGRLIGGLLMFLVYALIFWYLWFSKETKKFFHN